MSSRKIMVTGGAGFIGSHILRRLVEAGHQVLDFSLLPPQGEAAWWLRPVAEHIHFVQGSVHDSVKIQTVVKEFLPEVIIHLAAVVDPVFLNAEPELALRTNIGGTICVLEASRLFDVERVVFASSIAVLPTIQYEPVDASHPLMTAKEGPGASFYAAAKVGSEAFCWAYHQAYGLDFITIRPSAVYGFGQQYPIYIKPMVENSIKGLPTRFATGGDFPRDYTHVDDVTQIFQRAACLQKEDVQDRIFYAATGYPLVTAGQVAATVKSLIPNADIEIGSGLSANEQIELRYRGVLSIDSARRQLGYEPQYAQLKDGLIEYIEQYRHYLRDGAHQGKAQLGK